MGSDAGAVSIPPVSRNPRAPPGHPGGRTRPGETWPGFPDRNLHARASALLVRVPLEDPHCDPLIALVDGNESFIFLSQPPPHSKNERFGANNPLTKCRFQVFLPLFLLSTWLANARIIWGCRGTYDTGNSSLRVASPLPPSPRVNAETRYWTSPQEEKGGRRQASATRWPSDASPFANSAD